MSIQAAGACVLPLLRPSHDLPVGLAVRHHPTNGARDEDPCGESRDEVPPRGVRDVGWIVRIEDGVDNRHQPDDQADHRTEQEHPRWGDAVVAKGLSLGEHEPQQIDEQEDRGKGPQHRGGPHQHEIEGGGQVGRWTTQYPYIGDHHEEQHRQRACDAGLENDGVGGNTVAVEPAPARGDAPVDAPHQQEAGEDIVVDDRGHDQDRHDAQGGQASRHGAKRHLNRGHRRGEYEARVQPLDDEYPEGGEEIECHDDERSPQEVPCDGPPPRPSVGSDELTSHVQWEVHPEIAERNDPEQGKIRGGERIPVRRLAEVGGRRLLIEQPHQARDKHQRGREEDEGEGHIDNVLNHALPLQRDEAGKQDDYQQRPTLLPRLCQPVGVQPLDDVDDQFRRRQDQQGTGDPGGESDEEAHEPPERAVCPGIERSLVREDDAQLGGGDAAGDKKEEAADYPERHSRGATGNGIAIVGNEVEDHDKQEREVPGRENAR